MTSDLGTTLRKAVRELEGERATIEGQIAAVLETMRVLNGARGGRSVKPPTRTVAQRRAISRRMKRMWAKRRRGK